MDFLNKAFAQVADLFRSMTPGARITVGLLLAVVVVSLAWLFTVEGNGPALDLMNGVPIAPSDVSRMQEAFAKAGLNSYEIEGSHIKIPRGQRDAYMAALADHNALPANIETVFDDALKGGSPFETEQQRSGRMRIAKQKMLGLIIRAMRGVESASVLYDEQTQGHRFSPVKTITATAAVKADGGEALSETQVRGIRTLVAGAIAGLKAEDVTVTDLNGQTWHASAEGGGPMEDPYSSRKRMYEQQWERKILNALSYVPGVSVTPNVELDRERRKLQFSVQHDPKAVVIAEQEQVMSRVRDGAAPGGRPGYVAQQNQPMALAATRKQGSHEEEEESNRQAHSVTSGMQEESESVGLTPRRVSVAVSVPRSYFTKVWYEQNPPADASAPTPPDPADLKKVEEEEATKIQRVVAKLLPPATGVEDMTELVEVVTFQDIKTAAPPADPFSQQAIAWLMQNWTTVGMIAVAALSLLVLRSMLKADPSPRGTQPDVFAIQEGDEGDKEATAAVASRLSRFNTTGPSLRDELSELVAEDPDAAANILKGWIGQST